MKTEKRVHSLKNLSQKLTGSQKSTWSVDGFAGV
jgi:hypothetical protein